ncbi:hypothetical protein HMPREF9397_1467 [Streptococcus sanguinis SK1087]|uniref:Uncharacterized protein n=1 Tax=Streptococcus sanguinis SK1087 TaxID=888824 RepID=F3SJZ5_STRSA|nr:hypothetical protein HMPREF9397_1467 [Streptococcus sanguinis SK1087]
MKITEGLALARERKENLMMNMQNLFHDFLSLAIVKNIDLKPFLIH